MNKNNLNVRFDSATVTLDQTKQTDKITLRVGVQNVPVNVEVVDINGVSHKSTLDYNPIEHKFTSNSLTGNVPTGFTLTATSDANGNITATPAGQYLIANGGVTLGTDGTVPGTLQFVQYEKVTKTATYTGAVNGETGTTVTKSQQVGDFIHFNSKGVITTWNVVDEHGTVTQVSNTLSGTTHAEQYLNLKEIVNGVATVYEAANINVAGSYAANMNKFIQSLDLHNKLDTTTGENFGTNTEHLSGTPLAFSFQVGTIEGIHGHTEDKGYFNQPVANLAGGKGDTLNMTITGDTIAFSENPFHGMHVSYPGSAGSVDVISNNNEGLIVSESIDDNGLKSFNLNHVANAGELNTAHSLVQVDQNGVILDQNGRPTPDANAITNAVHSYLTDTTHATGELATYINQLTVTFDNATGDITIGDSSNGSFGYTLGQQQTHFNPQGYSLEIKETVQNNFQIPLAITIAPQNPQPGVPTPSINFGQLNFDKTTDQWTPNPTHTPGQEGGINVPNVPGHPGVKLVFDPTSKTFTLTTDGTFTPTDGGGMTWTHDPKTPNIWTGTPGTILNGVPTQQLKLDGLQAHSNTQLVHFAINVNTNTSTDKTNGTSYGTATVTHDLFTGLNSPLTFSNHTKITDQAGHEVVTGFDKHLSNHVGELPSQTGEQAFTVTSIPGFATEYTKSVDPTTKEVTYTANLSSHFDDNTGHRGGDNGLDGHKHKNNGENLSPVTVELTGDGFSPITGHITQDPITGEYNLIDTQTGLPVSLSKGNIHTVVTKENGNFVVTLGAGSTANNYNFDSASVTSGAFGGGSTHGTTTQKLSGDSMTINF